MRKIYQLIDKNILKDYFSEQLISKGDGCGYIPVITISREMGAGGHPIAELITKEMGKGWKIYHKQIIDKIAETSKLKKELFKEIDEKNPSITETILKDLFRKKYVTLSVYHKHLIEVLLAIGKRGKAVIVGRGANFVLPHALNVRVVCEMEQRIKWEMEFEKISRKEAIKRITKSDKERVEFVNNLFHHDLRKAHYYDLVIRTGQHMSIHDATNVIVNLAKRKFCI